MNALEQAAQEILNKHGITKEDIANRNIWFAIPMELYEDYFEPEDPRFLQGVQVQLEALLPDHALYLMEAVGSAYVPWKREENVSDSGSS